MHGWQRRGGRSLEMGEYMNALANERRRHMEEESDWLLAQVEWIEKLEALATALGISVDSENWWDETQDNKFKIVMGKISVLRSIQKQNNRDPRKR